MADRETELCELFGEVLGVPGIEPDDHFFDLGGHSLLASKLVKRIHERYGVRVTLRSFYDDPTARAVDKQLDQAA